MGTDKALLPYREGVLAGHVAGEVLAAVGSVKLVGDRERYGHLGFPVIGDRIGGNGPLGGIAAAVSDCDSWALVMACDMPNISARFLRELIQTAEREGAAAECVVPSTQQGPEPLCALYHRRALPLLDSFLDHKFLKMKDVVGSLQTKFVPCDDAVWFRNLNTPEDFRAHE